MRLHDTSSRNPRQYWIIASNGKISLLKTAKPHAPNTLYLLQTVPGIGNILSLVLLYEIHPIERFPRVQEFASYCRLIKCAKESNGKRSGTSGSQIGKAHLK
jgi:transposase